MLCLCLLCSKSWRLCPKIKYTPELSDAEKALRNYVIYGKKSLTDADWSVVTEGSEADYNFFKVGVDLK